ncbi:hypothetical protein ACFL38_02255 [Candidatus Omnitrophota bacterium]
MKKILICLIVLGFFLCTNAFAQDQTWKTRRNEKYGYEIHYPADWGIHPVSCRKKGDCDFEGFSKLMCSSGGDCLAELAGTDCVVQGEGFMNIYVKDSQGLSRDEWVENRINYFMSLTNKRAKIESPFTGKYSKQELPFTIGGENAIRVEEIRKPTAKPSDYFTANIYIKKGNRIYSFWLVNDFIDRIEFEETCEKMLKSFRFLEE